VRCRLPDGLCPCPHFESPRHCSLPRDLPPAQPAALHTSTFHPPAFRNSGKCRLMNSFRHSLQQYPEIPICRVAPARLAARSGSAGPSAFHLCGQPHLHISPRIPVPAGYHFVPGRILRSAHAVRCFNVRILHTPPTEICPPSIRRSRSPCIITAYSTSIRRARACRKALPPSPAIRRFHRLDRSGL